METLNTCESNIIRTHHTASSGLTSANKHSEYYLWTLTDVPSVLVQKDAPLTEQKVRVYMSPTVLSMDTDRRPFCTEGCSIPIAGIPIPISAIILMSLILFIIITTVIIFVLHELDEREKIKIP